MFRQALRWLKNKVVNRAQRLLLHVLAAGPIPKHIAFIMDGNRRYARSQQLRILEGHTEGFMALRKMLEICMRLGIKCVSVYAFAIENFKRAPEEVEALMAMAEDKLIEICRYDDLLDQYGVRLNVVGDVQLLPEHVLKAVQKAERLTRHNNRAILNVCMPYGSCDEIKTAVQACVRKAIVNDKPIISEYDIDSELQTSRGGSPPLDILIRTSGVKRLSDFLLWQCCEDTQIHFSPTYWPKFGLLDFIPIILDYQIKVWRR